MALKVITPTALAAEAAEVLRPHRDDVVVVGATAIEIGLAEAREFSITPTRDVDVVVPVERAAAVIERLEGPAVGMTRSELAHERGFTWERDGLKVQLVRTFHPHAKPPVVALPANPAFGMASIAQHQIAVAFDDAPGEVRLRCANAACLIGLKQAAFGRTRFGASGVVERDYHDAYLLMAAVPEDVAAGYAVAEYEVRSRVRRAVAALAGGGAETIAAAREMRRLDSGVESQRQAEQQVRRAALRMQRRLDALGPPQPSNT